MKCEEAVQEETVVSIDHFSKLSVNISAGINTYLLGEIANSLTEKIEKTSLTLNRTAVYTKTGKFTRLPQYLTVSFVRFQWKQSERLRAKILKKVKFPFELDLTSYCVPELITKMQPAKQRLIDIDDKKKDAKVRVFPFFLCLVHSYTIKTEILNYTAARRRRERLLRWKTLPWTQKSPRLKRLSTSFTPSSIWTPHSPTMLEPT